MCNFGYRTLKGENMVSEDVLVPNKHDDGKTLLEDIVVEDPFDGNFTRGLYSYMGQRKEQNMFKIISTPKPKKIRFKFSDTSIQSLKTLGGTSPNITIQKRQERIQLKYDVWYQCELMAKNEKAKVHAKEIYRKKVDTRIPIFKALESGEVFRSCIIHWKSFGGTKPESAIVYKLHETNYGYKIELIAKSGIAVGHMEVASKTISFVHIGGGKVYIKDAPKTVFIESATRKTEVVGMFLMEGI